MGPQDPSAAEAKIGILPGTRMQAAANNLSTNRSPNAITQRSITGIFGTEVSGVNQSITTHSDTERETTGPESDQARVVVNVLANASPNEVNNLDRDIGDTVGNNVVEPHLITEADAASDHALITDSTLNNLPSTAVSTSVSTTSATIPKMRSKRIVDSTINLIRFCHQKGIYLDIGLCAMKQKCYSVRAHEDAILAQNILAAIGGVGGFVPQRGQVVLAEKRPADRGCCQEECKSVEVGDIPDHLGQRFTFPTRTTGLKKILTRKSTDQA